MTPPLMAFAACTAVVVLVWGMAYQRLWRRFHSREITPTGFGVFLAPVLLAAGFVVGAPASVIGVLAIITVTGAIYWFDDLLELSARLRMAVCFLTGAAICGLLIYESGLPLWAVAASCLAAGSVNVVLTNIALIALVAGGILLFATGPGLMVVTAVACLAFIAPFALMNSRPKTLYLGDAGSFVFASVVTMMVVVYFRGGSELIALVAIPLALPGVDTFFVLCIRLREKHDLLTRNYLHLYQRLNREYRGFFYLAPQAINSILVLGVALVLNRLGFGLFAATAIAMVGVTAPFYFACRRFLLTSKSLLKAPV
jgi:UDP-N-acetylmuramyl pentapeptide phosphotransferase/UDP-N-acetylglucosamine-1-phosphate transferase